MNSTTTAPESRCFLLELPPEIRLMIYEDVTREQPSCFTLLVSSDSPQWVQGDVAKSLPITGVNRQLRQESIPVVYRNLEFIVCTYGEEYRRQAYLWMQEVDAAIVAAARHFVFQPGIGCGCFDSVVFNMANLEDSAQRDRSCPSCKVMDSYAEIGKKKVFELEVGDGGRRIMTKETLKSLVGLFCTLSKLCYR